MPKSQNQPSPPRKLSSIELTILGLAWLRGPSTTYSLMKELSMSESSYHKSRAGTAYSVSKRLIQFGLLERLSEPGEPTENLVKISPSGIEALQAWMNPPIPMSDVAHSADLIRLRFFFLGVVDPERRLAYIDDAIEGLQLFLQKCELLVLENEKIGDYFGVLATLSTILETRARITWLRFVRQWVEEPLDEETEWVKTILGGQVDKWDVGQECS